MEVGVREYTCWFITYNFQRLMPLKKIVKSINRKPGSLNISTSIFVLHDVIMCYDFDIV